MTEEQQKAVEELRESLIGHQAREYYHRAIVVAGLLSQTQSAVEQVQRELANLRHGAVKDGDSLTDTCVKLNAKVDALQARLLASEASGAEMRVAVENLVMFIRHNEYPAVGSPGFNEQLGLVDRLDTVYRKSPHGTAFLKKWERHIDLLRRAKELICDSRAEVAARTNAGAEPGCSSMQWIISGDVRDAIDEALKETK